MVKSRRRRLYPDGTAARNLILRSPAHGVARPAAPDLSPPARARLAMIDWHVRHGANVSRTARHFGFSRPTVYRWLARYDRLPTGAAALTVARVVAPGSCDGRRVHPPSPYPAHRRLTPAEERTVLSIGVVAQGSLGTKLARFGSPFAGWLLLFAQVVFLLALLIGSGNAGTSGPAAVPACGREAVAQTACGDARPYDRPTAKRRQEGADRRGHSLERRARRQPVFAGLLTAGLGLELHRLSRNVSL